MVFSGVVATVLALVLKVTLGWRISPTEERAGIDISRHDEAGYDLVGSLASRLDRRPVRLGVGSPVVSDRRTVAHAAAEDPASPEHDERSTPQPTGAAR